ncbi:MAG: flagellar basal body-associated FliL family protein [Alphaproteobacteria bacterium]|nr:flagellar basal body-associated FliL family protein [Alphaproteobacteria bacterium]
MADEDENEDKASGEDKDENAGEGGEGAEESDGGKSKKKLIIIAAALLILLLGGGGAGLYFTGMLDSLLGKGDTEHVEDGDHAAADDGGHGTKTAQKKKDKGGDHGGGHGGGDDGHGGGGIAFLEIPPIIVNLNTEDGTPRYLRLSVQLELENQDDLHAVEAIMPRVVDQFQTYLRELRVQDLRGSSGMYRIQTELLWRVNRAAAPVEVKDVLFQEFLIQ